MATVFIADLHLDDARPHIVELFEHFMQSATIKQASAVYILGDLVEAWVGDDDDAELPGRIARSIRAVSEGGVPVFFMLGNRDFLMGQDFATRAGMTLIEQDSIIRTIEGIPTLLMHGDTLCTDDVEYQQVRRQIRSEEWKQQVLAMPLAERRALAARSRQESRQHTGSSSESIMDVNQQTVEEAMQQAGVKRLIHGHTHRPAIHDFTLNNAPAQRIVLGDWYQHGSVLTVEPATIDLRGLSDNGS